MRKVLFFALSIIASALPRLAAQGSMVRIPEGSFTMGSPELEPWRREDEGPRAKISLSAFLLSDHETSFDEFDGYCRAVGKALLSDSGWGRGGRPAINVDWNEAIAYCNWLSRKEGLEEVYTFQAQNVFADLSAEGYRLPTEAEWEYACRAGSEGPMPGGDSLSSFEANFDGAYPYNGARGGPFLGMTLEAKSYAPNAYGLYDMQGNVWEWCWDCYGKYAGLDAKDPPGPLWSSQRVNRGGAWISGGNALRSAKRNANTPEFSSSALGFRVARSLPGRPRPTPAPSPSPLPSPTLQAPPSPRPAPSPSPARVFYPFYKIDVKPEYVNRADLRYPESARRNGKEGTVIVEADIDETGTIVEARVVKGAGYGFDEAARLMVSQSSFTPAMAGGRAVPVRMRFTVEFSLK